MRIRNTDFVRAFGLAEVASDEVEVIVALIQPDDSMLLVSLADSVVVVVPGQRVGSGL